LITPRWIWRQAMHFRMSDDEFLAKYDLPKIIEMRAYDHMENHLDPWMQTSVLAQRFSGGKFEDHRPKSPLANDTMMTREKAESILAVMEAAGKRAMKNKRKRNTPGG